MPRGAYIFGLKGKKLNAWETAFFKDADPWGFILFARNVGDPEQLRALTSQLRETVGWQIPILIDQEGGRVQRMGAPHWRKYLPALDQMLLSREPMRAHWLRNRLIAAELYDVGIDVNCAPLADLLEDNTHPVLANRLSGTNVSDVVNAAKVCADALQNGGVLPVLKHIPGYGRASVDSHLECPKVTASLSELTRRDFLPFEALNAMPMGMTAHIVYEAIDPDQPATTSENVMRVIRRDIGFDGLIMTDDISMEALSGNVAERSDAAIRAGCDIVLHCNARQKEMQDVAVATGRMGIASASRAEVALLGRMQPSPIDISACAEELETLLA